MNVIIKNLTKSSLYVSTISGSHYLVPNVPKEVGVDEVGLQYLENLSTKGYIRILEVVSGEEEKPKNYPFQKKKSAD
jgi:hypothetical protein